MGKFLLVIVVFALVVYGLFWLLERRGKRKTARTRPRPPAAPKRTLGPDDDEDFLRQLEQHRRRAEREQQKKKKDKRPEDEDKPKDQSRPE